MYIKCSEWKQFSANVSCYCYRLGGYSCSRCYNYCLNDNTIHVRGEEEMGTFKFGHIESEPSGLETCEFGGHHRVHGG